MESAESCLVVSDFLHGSGSTWPHPCHSGAAASGKEPGNGGQGAQGCWLRRRGPGMDLGQNCCALAQSRPWSWCCLVLLLPREHLPGSSSWLGWDMARGQGDLQHCAGGQNPTFPPAFPPDLR